MFHPASVRSLVSWALACLAVTLAAATIVILLVALSNKQGPYAPLGPYPVQTVTNRVDGFEGPAVQRGGTLVVEGELCNKADHPVNVLTTLSWQALNRTGTFVAVGIDVPQVREPGCEKFSQEAGNPFRNPMPSEVVAASVELGPEAEWVVTGFEVPLRDHTSGVRQSFTTEPFRIVP